ncbi:hypothetical protein ABRT01_13500 [Lentibacillus sp. L22]|uniref:hypothetical protein n=1 Tax=Lentibacillus sp. L22 TaxID=3163028 RepID=UPI0034673E1B
MAMKREVIKRFIETVPAEKLSEFEKLILEMIPEDDEPLTDEEIADIRRARKEFEEGRTVSLDTLLKELEESD